MEHITNRQALIEALLGAVKLITFGFTQYGKATFAYHSATLPLAGGIARDINRLKEAGTKLTK